MASENEYTVAAYVLEHPEAVASATDKVRDSFFSDAFLASVFRSAVRGREKRFPVTFHVVDQMLRKRARSAEQMAVYRELVTYRGRAADEFSLALREMAAEHERRVLIDGLTRLGNQVVVGDIGSARAELDAMKRAVDQVTGVDGGIVTDVRRDVAMSESAYDEAEADRQKPAGQSTRTMSGFGFLDAVTGGAVPGHLWLWGGATSEGKSQFAVELAYRVCAQRKNVFFTTLEMSVQEVKWLLEVRHSHRIKEGGLSYRRVRDGMLDRDDRRAYRETLEDWRDSKEFGRMMVWQPPYGCTVETLKTKMETVDAESRLDLVVVDYLELLDLASRGDYRIQLTEKLRTLKALARSFRSGEGVWIFSPHQTSKQARDKAAKRGYYAIGDLAETINAERVANLVGWILKTDRMEEENKVRCGVMKYRSGDIRGIRKGVDLMGDFAHSLIDEIEEGSEYGVDGVETA